MTGAGWRYSRRRNSVAHSVSPSGPPADAPGVAPVGLRGSPSTCRVRVPAAFVLPSAGKGNATRRRPFEAERESLDGGVLTRWALRRPRRVLLAALVLGLLLAAAAAGTGSRLPDGGYIAEGTEATRTDTDLRGRLGAGIPDVRLEVRAAGGRSAAEPAVAPAGLAYTRRAGRQAGVGRVASFWSTGDARLPAKDGRATPATPELPDGEYAAARRARDLVPAAVGAPW
jgi:hypothetical protein